MLERAHTRPIQELMPVLTRIAGGVGSTLRNHLRGGLRAAPHPQARPTAWSSSNGARLPEPPTCAQSTFRFRACQGPREDNPAGKGEPFVTEKKPLVHRRRNTKSLERSARYLRSIERKRSRLDRSQADAVTSRTGQPFREYRSAFFATFLIDGDMYSSVSQPERGLYGVRQTRRYLRTHHQAVDDDSDPVLVGLRQLRRNLICWPSTTARVYPSVAKAVNRSVNRPFLSTTRGARTCILVLAGSCKTSSTMSWTVLLVISNPHSGQCGASIRAQSRRM